MRKIIEKIFGIACGIILGSLLLAPFFGGFVWLDYAINSWRYDAEPTKILIFICIFVGAIAWAVLALVGGREESNKKTESRK